MATIFAYKKPNKSNRDTGLCESPRGIQHRGSSSLQDGLCHPVGTFMERSVRARCGHRDRADVAQHHRGGGCFLQGRVRGRERDEERVQSPTKITSKGELQFFLNKPKLLSTFPKRCKSSYHKLLPESRNGHGRKFT